MEFRYWESLSLILAVLFWSNVAVKSTWSESDSDTLHLGDSFPSDDPESSLTLPSDDQERIKRAEFISITNGEDSRYDSGGPINLNFNVPHVNQTFIAFGKLVRGFTDTMEKTFRRLNSSRDTAGLAINVNMMDTQKLVDQSFQRGELGWLNRQKSIDNIWANNREGADPLSSVGTAFTRNAPNSESMALSNTSILLEYASLAFMKGYKGPGAAELSGRLKRQDFLESNAVWQQSSEMMERIDIRRYIRENPIGGSCTLREDTQPCDPTSRYRTYSGWCNNLKNPEWGKSVTTFDRMIPAVYADGISLPKSQSVTGRALPSPRYVSQMVHVDVSHLSQRHTLMFMQYGQFLDHDLTFTPVNKGPGNAILNCRDCESTKEVHPECWPIPVPTGDMYYPNQNAENGRAWCLPFTRSLPGQQRLGPREQINQNSGYLDSSQVYGEHMCKMTSLRGGRGFLNTTTHPTGGKDLLPQMGGMRECKSPSGYCFHAGDPRSSEQPALAVVHTVHMREHNRIADELHRINPHWSDEKVFQESRRILGAQSQHITYKEYLPKLLGANMVHAYDLRLNNDGYYNGYDPYCKAKTYNEFAAAAFRFGHSLIRPSLARMDNRYNGMQPNIQLREGFFNSDMMYKHLMVDEILRGLLAEPMEQMDPFITNEIRNHLFEDKKKSFSGLDLISLNLHRGRDHGLDGYNAYRAACNLKRAYSFEELEGEIPMDVIGRLKQAYAHVDDIDLFTGSLVERNVHGGIVGPTMSCIIGNQFKLIRKCDRFWYETSDPAIQFSPQQLAEIRKSTLSKLICSNFDMSSDIQKDAFDAPHKILNPRIPCERLPTINLEFWRETPSPLPLYRPATPITGCYIAGRQIRAGESVMSSPCVSCKCTLEGTKCASIKVTNCHGLLRESSRYDILRDDVCKAQCGYMFGDSSVPYVSKNVLNIVNGRNRLNSQY